MLNTEASGVLERHLAGHLGRQPSHDEVGLASALATLRPGEGVSLLRLPAVAARCGISKSQIYALIAEGSFSKPTHVHGSRVSVWSSEIIDRWVAAQLNVREV